jgi:glycosyltransferase involved in cell wall biosynthesis
MSVVVPAYNVEGFITAALDSLLSQPRAAEV